MIIFLEESIIDSGINSSYLPFESVKVTMLVPLMRIYAFSSRRPFSSVISPLRTLNESEGHGSICARLLLITEVFLTKEDRGWCFVSSPEIG